MILSGIVPSEAIEFEFWKCLNIRFTIKPLKNGPSFLPAIRNQAESRPDLYRPLARKGLVNTIGG